MSSWIIMKGSYENLKTMLMIRGGHRAVSTSLTDKQRTLFFHMFRRSETSLQGHLMDVTVVEM